MFLKCSVFEFKISLLWNTFSSLYDWLFQFQSNWRWNWIAQYCRCRRTDYCLLIIIYIYYINNIYIYIICLYIYIYIAQVCAVITLIKTNLMYTSHFTNRKPITLAISQKGDNFSYFLRIVWITNCSRWQVYLSYVRWTIKCKICDGVVVGKYKSWFHLRKWY